MTEVAEKLLTSYPDYGKAHESYLLTITELLASLSDDVIAAVLDLKTGVRARCSFLPTVADIVKCADEYIAKRDQFKPPPREGIHKLLPRYTEREPTEAERQRTREHWAAVKAEIEARMAKEMGSKKLPPMMVPPELNDVEAAEWVHSRLRTPAKPPSQELKELVARQMQGNDEEKWT